MSWLYTFSFYREGILPSDIVALLSAVVEIAVYETESIYEAMRGGSPWHEHIG